MILALGVLTTTILRYIAAFQRTQPCRWNGPKCVFALEFFWFFHPNNNRIHGYNAIIDNIFSISYSYSISKTELNFPNFINSFFSVFYIYISNIKKMSFFAPKKKIEARCISWCFQHHIEKYLMPNDLSCDKIAIHHFQVFAI